jgi:hypothetical protein
MINLEKLALYFVTNRNGTFINGIHLKTNIINHMSRLNEFIFNIQSIVRCNNPMHLLSNEDIYLTFQSFEYYKIICCVDYFPRREYGQCHIYSYPYALRHYDNITNNFPGGLFPNVQEITLFDEHPFQHEFFIQISQAFPLLEKLSVSNFKPQNFNDDNRKFSVIEYSHLTALHLFHVHDDYVEQFLFDTKTSLPNFIRLSIDYDQLQRVTHDFTRDTTRNNCSKIKTMRNSLQLPKHNRSYFPHLE